MPASHASEIEVMVEAVRTAGRICRSVQSELVSADTLEKQDRSPVTIADLASQAIVARRLADAFPSVPLVAEEESSVLAGAEHAELRASIVERVRTVWSDADEASVIAAIDLGRFEGGGSGRFFTLDPVDGTKGFLRGVQYAVALALVVEGRLAAAVLGCPNLEDGVLYIAERGRGTRRVTLDGDGIDGEPVRVSDRADPTAIRFCESVESGHTDQGHSASIADALGVQADPVRLDSQCKYGVVAAGGAELYLRMPTERRRKALIWDHAAGALAVMEAGGRVTDLDGRDLDFGHGSRLSENRGVVASNGHVHDVVLQTIAALGI